MRPGKEPSEIVEGTARKASDIKGQRCDIVSRDPKPPSSPTSTRDEVMCSSPISTKAGNWVLMHGPRGLNQRRGLPPHTSRGPNSSDLV